MEAKLVNKYRKTREQLSAACALFHEMENGIGWAIRINTHRRDGGGESRTYSLAHSIEWLR